MTAACLVGAGRLDQALAVFDFQADANVAATFSERTYPGVEWLVGGQEVMEDARLWMPEDASYGVVEGPRSTPARARSLRFFLFVLMQPRTQMQLGSTPPWVFCFGCTRSTLGPEYEVLSDSGRGFLFARRSS